MCSAVCEKEVIFNAQGVSEQQYSIVSEYLVDPILGSYHTYGIQVTAPDYTDIVHDVSVSRKNMVYMVELINQYKLCPMHLHDVIEDMLP